MNHAVLERQIAGLEGLKQQIVQGCGQDNLGISEVLDVATQSVGLANDHLTIGIKFKIQAVCRWYADGLRRLPRREQMTSIEVSPNWTGC